MGGTSSSRPRADNLIIHVAFPHPAANFVSIACKKQKTRNESSCRYLVQVEGLPGDNTERNYSI